MSLVLNRTDVARPGDDFPRIDEAELAALAFLARYSGKTLESYRQDLRHFFAWCAERRLPVLDMRRELIELWIRDQEENGFTRTTKAGGTTRHPYKPKTMNRRISTVQGFFRIAFLDGRIAADPAVHLRKKKVYDEDRPPIDPEEARRFLAEASRLGGARQVLMLFMAHNGLRVSEVCQLDVEDLTYENGHRVARFIGKGNKPGRAVIGPALSRAIDRYLEERHSGPLLLREGGDRLTRRTAYDWVQQVKRRAKVEGHFHPHLLRAVFISEALAAGIPIADVQHDARHSDPRTTMRYDRRRHNDDRHSTFIVGARLAGG